MKRIYRSVLILGLILILVLSMALILSGWSRYNFYSNYSVDNSEYNYTIPYEEINYGEGGVKFILNPVGFKFLSAQTVKAKNENIGINGDLDGYRGDYIFNNDTVSNKTVYFYCFKANSIEDASIYYWQMIDSYEETYTSVSISEMSINLHEAAVFKSGSNGVGISGPDMIAWTRGDYLFVIKGQVKGVDFDNLEDFVICSAL